jgi:hypothetical protein
MKIILTIKDMKLAGISGRKRKEYLNDEIELAMNRNDKNIRT